MVITTTLANIQFKKVLLYQENLFNILYWSTFQKLGIPSLSPALFITFDFGRRKSVGNKRMG